MNLEEKAKEYLRGEALLMKTKHHWIVAFDNGRKIDLVTLFADFAQQTHKELIQENERLNREYSNRCNEVKDKVETIHNYLHQLTAKDKELEELINVLTFTRKRLKSKGLATNEIDSILTKSKDNG